VKERCLAPQRRNDSVVCSTERNQLSSVHVKDGTVVNQRKTFRALFCEHFECPAKNFEKQLFRTCLHRHAIPFRRLAAKLDPDFFREDLGLIADLATAASHEEVISELNRFYGRNVRDRNWFRRSFSIRISGKRVLKISRRLF
jgi:hypothetical protein